jgi:hypothetical protein
MCISLGVGSVPSGRTRLITKGAHDWPSESSLVSMTGQRQARGQLRLDLQPNVASLRGGATCKSGVVLFSGSF